MKNQDHKDKVSVRQRWIEASIVGCSIGLIVLMLQMVLSKFGVLVNVLAFAVAAIVIYGIQVVISAWMRRE